MTALCKQPVAFASDLGDDQSRYLFKNEYILTVFLMDFLGDAAALLAGQRTCDLQVAGSSPGWTPLHSGLEQATYTCVPLSPSSIIWYQPNGVISLAGKIAAGLVESSSRLLPGLWVTNGSLFCCLAPWVAAATYFNYNSNYFYASNETLNPACSLTCRLCTWNIYNVNVNVQYLSTRKSCKKELRRLRHKGCLQQTTELCWFQRRWL